MVFLTIFLFITFSTLLSDTFKNIIAFLQNRKKGIYSLGKLNWQMWLLCSLVTFLPERQVAFYAQFCKFNAWETYTITWPEMLNNDFLFFWIFSVRAARHDQRFEWSGSPQRRTRFAATKLQKLLQLSKKFVFKKMSVERWYF